MAVALISGRLGVFSALRHRDFRWFFLNIGVQSFGQGIQFLGIGWLILDLTGEKTLLGLAVSIFGVANLFFTFAGGVIADRVERRLFLIVCVLGIGLVTLALGLLAALNLVAVWHIFVAVFLLGGLMALQMPARFALAADLVPREDMMNAVALHTSVGQIGNMIGPLAGGWFIAAMGTGSAIILNGVSVLSGILFLLAMSKPAPGRRTGASPVADLMGGFRALGPHADGSRFNYNVGVFRIFRNGVYAGNRRVCPRVSAAEFGADGGADDVPGRGAHLWGQWWWRAGATARARGC